MELAAIKFGVGPAARSGTIANGPIKGMKASWAPRFRRDDRAFRRMDGPDGSRYEMAAEAAPGEPAFMAETWPDGEVTLRFEAFGTALDRNSAAVLAAVLAHEAVHFDQLVGPGWKSFGIDEAPAYEAELATAQRLGLPRSWTQSTESGMKAAKAQAFKERLFGGPSPFRSPEAEAAIKREFEAVADARQERDDRIYRLRAELADQRKWMAGLKKRWHYADLENIAFNACA